MTTRNVLKAAEAKSLKIDGWMGERIDLTWRNNLLKLDWDGDFLRPFQEKVWGDKGEYVGLGKTFEALVRFSLYTSDPNLQELLNRVRDKLLASQEGDGYLGTYYKERRTVSIWDIHELAYILHGLAVDWEQVNDTRSYRAAQKLADYLVSELSQMSLEKIGESSIAFGGDAINPELAIVGLDRAMLAWFRITKDEKYLNFCTRYLSLPEWGLPIVQGRNGRVEGHAYSYLSHCLAQLDLYDITGDDNLLGQTKRALEFLRSGGGLVVTGTCSQSECWHSDQDGSGELGETCATAYLIRLCARLLCKEGVAEYGDLMERSIYNALFAAQGLDGRRIRYYTPFEGPRVFWDTDIYCCPGNYRRIISELPQFVYLTGFSEVIVNLYTTSGATLTLDGGLEVGITQETEYPSSGDIKFRISTAMPATFSLKLRIPAWCQAFAVLVNGARVQASAQDGWLELRREWNESDMINLEMEMPWRILKGTALQKDKFALLRGPVLFCMDPARNSMAAQNVAEFVLDANAIKSPVASHEMRAGGIECHVSGEHSCKATVLTEFVDPNGRLTYFKGASGLAGCDDELLS